MATKSGDWLLQREFTTYARSDLQHTPFGQLPWLKDQYHYAAFTCSNAMYQLGGDYWKGFYPPVVKTLLANQKEDGSWPPETICPQFKNCYRTALSVLTFSIPDQLLPIFQR
jgi:hypothetical protein